MLASHFIARVTTNQARTGATSFADVSGAEIPVASSGNWGGLVAGGKYLIMVRASVAGSQSNTVFRARMAAGGAAIAESELAFEPSNGRIVVGSEAATANRYSYFYPDIYTVPGTPVALTFQIATDASGQTVWADQIVMVAIRLDNIGTDGTDFAKNDDASDFNMGTTLADTGAVLAWTPASATDRELLITYAQIEAGTAITSSAESRASLTGGTTEQWGLSMIEPGDAIDLIVQGFPRVMQLPTSSHTLAVQVREESTANHTHLHSRAIRVNLSALFVDVSAEYTSGSITPAATPDWNGAAESLSHTKTAPNGPLFVGAACIDNVDSLGEAMFHRLQVDDVDAPDTQTADEYPYMGSLNDNTDQVGWAMFDVVDITGNVTIDHDIHQSAAGPDSLNRQIFAFSLEVPSTGPDPLAADQGSFALTGQTAGLTRALKLNAEHGSFALSGQAAALSRDLVVAGEHGAFALAGQDAELDYSGAGNVVLTAETGMFTLSGQAAALTRALQLPAAHATFALAGQDAGTRVAYRLTAEHGSFALAGQSIVFGSTVPADIGLFTLSGQDVGLRRALKLNAEAGLFTLSGQDAALTHATSGAVTLTADQGAFTLSGQSAGLRRALRLTCETGTFTLSGQPANLVTARRLSAEHGTFALAGQAATLATGFRVTADHGAFSLAGQAAGLKVSRRLLADTGMFVLSGQDAGLEYSGSPPPIVGHVRGSSHTRTRYSGPDSTGSRYGGSGDPRSRYSGDSHE